MGPAPPSRFRAARDVGATRTEPRPTVSELSPRERRVAQITPPPTPGGSDVREPGTVAIVTPANDREERLLEAPRQRPGPPVADAAAVELPDRRHLGRRAGEEGLV